MLTVIVPYFNPLNEELREKNTLEFLNYLNSNNDVDVVLVEVSTTYKPLPIYERASYIRVCPKTLIWRKENLINMAVEQLPDYVDSFAWIDSDLTFLRPDWATATLDLLHSGADIVQMFSGVIMLEENSNVTTIARGIIENSLDAAMPVINNMLPGHPGFAWAMRKGVWKKIGKLPDKGIVGGGDTELAYALLGQLALLKGEKSIAHWEWLKKWGLMLTCCDLSVSWLPGAIVHHWHGPEKLRGYFSRSSILIDNNYNPDVDVAYDKNGLLELTPTGLRLQGKIEGYFKSRVSYQGA
jgi:hypothetical protein